MNGVAQWWARTVIENRRVIILVCLVVTGLFALGIPFIEEERDLGQFESGSPAVEASEYIQTNMVPEEVRNQTPIQVIREAEDGENVLTREEFIQTIEFQQELATHPEIGPTFVEDEPITGIPNVIALLHIREILTVETEQLASLNESQAMTLSQGLGFNETEQETVVQLIALFEMSEESDDPDQEETGDDTDWGEISDAEMLQEMSEDEIRELAAAAGFDETAQETVVELAALFTVEGAVAVLPTVADATPDEQRVLTELLGVSEVPDEACLTELAAGEQLLTLTQQPPLSCQLWALSEMSDSEFENTVQSVLGPDGEPDALALVPQSYEPGSTETGAHTFIIPQQTEGGALEEPDGFSETVTQTQFDVREMGEQSGYRVFGFALLDTELEQSLEDSTFIVIPVALLFVVVVLAVVYRDVFDILLGVAGIVAVLAWTFGFMGWSGIAFNQVMVAVPALLVGLSVDFALHVFMRHREHRYGSVETVERSMRLAVGGVILALAWVTATAGIGFLSNLVSPIGPLRDFGIISAFGIGASLVVFGTFVPAAKVELDTVLEQRGYDRNKRAFGTGDSWVSRLLASGAVVAGKFPVAVVVVALLLTVGGVYGATQVDTQFDETDFLAEDPPAWSQALPGPFAANEYQVTDDVAFVQENFQQTGRVGELLIQGNVTHPETLRWLEATAENASERETVFVLPNGEPDVRSPVTALENTVRFAPGSSLSASVADGTPTENISGLYDEMIALNPGTADLLHRTDSETRQGTYEAIRIQFGTDGTAPQADATADINTVAAFLEAESGGELTATPTGTLIINTEIERNLFETVIQSLIVTLLTIFLFLAVAYRLTGNTASLGIVTLLPVLFSVTWILGTMWLIGMPFNALTGTIAALTIGLGIDYSIHISDRYQLELQRQGSVRNALQTTVTGTGGALLGTAATTVGGFWTLTLAMMPALQQFGLIIGVTIIYAFLASVLVLPSMLVLWTRYVDAE